jgi:hypothetical protein
MLNWDGWSLRLEMRGIEWVDGKGVMVAYGRDEEMGIMTSKRYYSQCDPGGRKGTGYCRSLIKGLIPFELSHPP